MRRVQIFLALGVVVASRAAAQAPTFDPRADPFVTAWKAMSSEADRIPVAAQFGPVDQPLLSAISTGGEDLQKKGNFPGARQRFEVCSESAEVANNDLYSSICVQLLGGLDRLEGKYEDAEQHYMRALEFAKKPGATRRIPLVLNNLAGLYVMQARYSEGVENLQAAIDYNDKEGIATDAAPYQNLGSIYGLTGDMARSMRYFLTARGIYDRKGDERKLALVHYNIGVLYAIQSNYASAGPEFDTALTLAVKTGDKTTEAMIHGDIGRMLGHQNKPKEAIVALNRALDLTRGLGFKSSYDDALLNIANFETDRGDFSLAIDHYKEALQLAEELKDGHNQGTAIRGLGLIARSQQNFRAALAYAGDGLKVADRIGDRVGQWQSEALAGLAWRGLADDGKARDSFQRAIALIEQQRGMVAGGEVDKQLFFEQAVFPYQELALVEARSGNTLGALQAAERTRTRVLLEIIEAGPNPIDRWMSDDERAEEKRLRAVIATANARPTPGSRQRDDAWHAYQSFLTALYVRKPELRTWRGDSPVIGENDLEALVPDSKTAFIEFLSGRDETLLFTVTRTAGKLHVRTFHLPVGREELTSRAGLFRTQLEGRDPGFRATSRALYDLLLKPAFSELSNRGRVYIVADGPLWELPFQALPWPAGGYWIEHAALSLAPSMGFLRDQNARAPEASRNFTHDLIAFSGLPEMDNQIRRIGALYGNRAVLRTGPEARESAFKADAPDARVLHLAAHGIVDRQNALHSRVMLAPVEGHSQPEDGWLEAWEIMRMNLNADLAILSACETGRGRLAEGEGLVGLTWALFVSGVKTTVVSQWQVEERSTTQLMVGLHSRLLHGDKPAEALRGAVLALMKDSRYSHPMYWSAFVVAGL